MRNVVSAPAAIVLPAAVAERLSELPRRGCSDPVARYARRGADGATVLLWSAPPLDRTARLIGALTLRWRTPGPDTATVTRLSWDLAQGGSEARVRAALDGLLERAGVGLTGARQ